MLSTLFDPLFDPFCPQLAAFSEALWCFFWTVPRSHAPGVYFCSTMTLMTLLWRPCVKNLGPKVGKTPAPCQVELDGIGYSPNNWTWHVVFCGPIDSWRWFTALIHVRQFEHWWFWTPKKTLLQLGNSAFFLAAVWNLMGAKRTIARTAKRDMKFRWTARYIMLHHVTT